MVEGPLSGSVEPTEQERVAAATVLRMIQGTLISRAVYVVAELGIADLLASGPMTSDELARATQTNERSLYRVLRLLASLGVFAEENPRSFSLTLLGDRLRTDVPASVRSWAMLVEALGGVRAFEHIVHTVRTGEPGIETAHGMGIFEFLARTRRTRRTSTPRWRSELQRSLRASPLITTFSRMRTVVDVGGGQGILLAAILRRHTHLRGILFEVPTVAAGAEAMLMASDIADRSEIRAGDFFDRIPDGADGYVMANVLHDWDDARAVEILGNCRRAMAEDGRVLIVERLIPDDPSEAAPTLLSDINMLVFTGGQERTNAEYGQILTAARMRRGKVLPVAFPYGVIEGLTA